MCGLGGLAMAMLVDDGIGTNVATVLIGAAAALAVLYVQSSVATHWSERELASSVALQTDLSGCDLHGRAVDGFHLRGRSFAGAKLSNSDLRRSDLTGADLNDARLTEAALDRADLSETDLTKAGLYRVRARHTIFRGARMRRAVLEQGDFREACFCGAVLDGADLSHGDLRGCHLIGATLIGCELEDVRLQGALYDDSTSWPADFDYHAAGAEKQDDFQCPTATTIDLRPVSTGSAAVKKAIERGAAAVLATAVGVGGFVLLATGSPLADSATADDSTPLPPSEPEPEAAVLGTTRARVQYVVGATGPATVTLVEGDQTRTIKIESSISETLEVVDSGLAVSVFGDEAGVEVECRLLGGGGVLSSDAGESAVCRLAQS